MRMVAVILAASLAGVIAVGEAAGQEVLTPPVDAVAPDGDGTTADQGTVSREAQFDQLFAALATAKSASQARASEKKIIDLWMASGSDTVDLLMQWTLRAIDDEDYPLALDYLDRITTLKPDYAEGWNKRATVYYLIDDYGKSLADIERVLALEPRHFAALSGLGAILHAIGDDEWAVEAYKRALEIDPYLDQVREALDKLSKKGPEI